MGKSRVRYAVVGLGYIAQVAVLPAFRNAKKNSTLTALVSGDPVKRRRLAEEYDVPLVADYENYDALMHSGEVDAVYIALPNSMHAEYTIRAAEAGVHVLCEKPLAVSVRECEEMVAAAQKNRVRLMTAYRLHFEKANLAALEAARSGKLGELRAFSSTFSMQVKRDNIRTKRRLGGGPLFDLGIYCLNAARSLFRAEPLDVSAFLAYSDDPRFDEVEEMISAQMRFPGDRLASFIASFGASDTASLDLIGTKGHLRLDPAFEYAEPLGMRLTVNGRRVEREYARRDQFAPELLHFSECVLDGKEPEPSGREGLADVRVIEALIESARTGAAVSLSSLSAPQRLRHPAPGQEIRRPPVERPDLVHAEAPSRH